MVAEYLDKNYDRVRRFPFGSMIKTQNDLCMIFISQSVLLFLHDTYSVQ
jgi:hypothetical protein